MQVPKLKIEYLPTGSLVPYAHNSKKHDAKDVGCIIESIEDFSFNDPVSVWENESGELEIVEGHGRVMAAKKLGIDELPVIKLKHLTDRQRRAYTHVHNQTTLNSALDMEVLEEEFDELGDEFDFEDFGFDLGDDDVDLGDDADDDAIFGEERLRTDYAYNLDIVNIDDCGSDGMPAIAAVDYAPDHLIGFNYAKTSDDTDAGIHFFIDDYQFERCWNAPKRYIEVLMKYDCVLTPDFSLYLDMPLPMQQWNVYRSRALGCFWQKFGMAVIPTLSWSTKESFSFAFSGLEKGGTYAVSTIGVKGDDEAMSIWRDGMDTAMRVLEPKRILQYGGDIGFDYGACEVVNYTNSVTERMRNGR